MDTSSQFGQARLLAANSLPSQPNNRWRGPRGARSLAPRAWAPLVLLTIIPGTSVAGTAPEPASVQALLKSIAENPNYFDPNQVDRKISLAVELGKAALPQLESRLEKASSDQEREALGTAIAYIGGTSAISSLRAAVQHSSSLQLKDRVAFAIPSEPSKELTDLLLTYLQGPHLGDGWPLIVQSAYSLGIMRTRDAVTALRATADQHEKYSTFASSAARDALDWIAGPDVTVKFLASAQNDDLLQAVLSSGVPTINRRSSWCELSAGRSWKKVQRSWIVEPGCSHGKEPTIGFDAFRSSDGTRAVVAIGFHLGPLDGAGYNYLLQKRGDQWVVTGLEFTWVS